MRCSTPDAVRRSTTDYGTALTRAMFEAFAQCSAERHRRRAHELRERGHALPGAAAAVSALAATDGVVQTVVTGNIRPVTETELVVFGLDTHVLFPYGGYGEDHDDRAELVRTAMTRSAEALGGPIKAANVLLIGETPADVAAARSAGVPVLSVATGRSTLHTLAEAGAAHVIPNLQNLPALFVALRR
ncbi:haloacid dehalogenase-like hydrolase [Streptomyces sp. NPDC002476]|uniref:haloacid dehalogenase-like hydrolase n=1 Tax=Streptomyces sp. NPDC002476 TaxID=3364648 RepID=UPI0036B6BA7D